MNSSSHGRLDTSLFGIGGIRGFSLALLIALAIPLTATAQDLSPEQMEAFEQHIASGGKFMDEGRFKEAIDELSQARELIDHPRLSVGIAGAYLSLDRCSAAQREFQSLVERPDLSEELQERAQTGLAEARDDCQEVAALRIDCQPAEVSLRLDGQPISCPFEEDVLVGDHPVEASAQGFEDHASTITVVPEEVTEVRITLDPVEVEPPSGGWATYVSYGAMGAGALMLAGGGMLDYRAGARSTEIAQAQQQGDFDRIAELESSASTAKLTTAILYVSGVALLGGGIALQFIDLSSSDEDSSGFAVDLSPGGISTTFRW